MNENGQIFSLDFMISTALVILAIGMALNYYDLASNQEKEARLQTETATIGGAVSMLLLEKNPCQTNFGASGYSATNCSALVSSYSTTKDALMIPDGFNCQIKVDGTALSSSGCGTQDPDTSASDVSVIERNYVRDTSTLLKKEYEQCIAGQDCPSLLSTHKLEVAIWR